jgi:hypothetical protein
VTTIRGSIAFYAILGLGCFAGAVILAAAGEGWWAMGVYALGCSWCGAAVGLALLDENRE